MENTQITRIKKLFSCSKNAIEDNTPLKYNLKSVAQTFTKFHSNLAECLLKNHPNSPTKFDMNSVHQYCKNIEPKDNFNLTLTTERKDLEILQCIDISKAAGIDKISGRFLKDGENILAKPIAEICIPPVLQGFSQVTAKLLN